MTTSSGEHDGQRPRFEYVTRGRRVLIAYIDSALASGTYALLYGLPFVHRTVVVDFVTGVLALALTVTLVVRLGGTPAKLLLAARVVDARGELLTIRRAMLREIPSIATMLVGLWVLQDVLAGLPRGSAPPSSAELGEAYRASGRLWAVNLVSWCRLVDVAVVLFNPARRAIHDYLAGSYVITKRSFLAVRGLGPPVDVESLPSASLPVRAFASLLIVFCAAQLAKIAFFDLFPLLWSNDLRGGGLGSEHAIAAFVLASFFVQTLVTLLAGIALVSNRTWARAWVICISAAAVAPIVMTLAAGGRPESWDEFATNLDRPLLALIYGLPIAHLALAILALVLFLAYDRWRPDAPAIHGREWAAALVGVLALFGVERGLSFDVRHAWDERRIAATTVEDGTGTAVVTLTYGGKPLEEPDGTPCTSPSRT